LRRVPDHRDHLPVAALRACGDESAQQQAANAFAVHVRRDIDRIFDAPIVSRPCAIGAGIGVAGDDTFDLGGEIGIAVFEKRGLPAQHFRFVRRLDLERRGAAKDGIGVDARDCFDVGRHCWTDNDLLHQLVSRFRSS